MEQRPPIAVITGAAQGIGRAAAAALATAYDVRLLDLDAAVHATAREVAGPAGATGYRCDVTDDRQVAEAAQQITAGGAAVRVLVNNAGWTSNERFLDQSPQVRDRLLAVNLRSVLLTTSVFAPRMPPGSAIVNVASDAARTGVPKEAVYAAAKAGVIAFSKAMAVELGRADVRVNVVSPGTTATPLVTAALSDDQVARRLRGIPLGRLGEPSDVAEAIRWLACDADYVTGQVLSVNGGATRVG